METILDKIIAEKRKEVKSLKEQVKQKTERNRKKYSLISRISQATEVSIISEFKRASPSKGDINLNLDPIKQTQLYVNAGADAVSVLTDYSFFKGSFTDLEIVANNINVPILCKDFVIDPVQIDIALQSGADLILLIAAVLEEQELERLYEYARLKDLEVLMEVHNETELEKVLKTGNKLIGINNRNLKTFEVDLAITEKLAKLIKDSQAYVISESGIKSKREVERVVKAGANGILVGEAFMTHSNVTEGLKEMKISLPEVEKR